MTPPDERPTNAPFSKEEVAQIRGAIETPGTTVDCPRCGTLLTPERPRATKGQTPILWLYCAQCQRNLVIRGVKLDGS